jgi:coronin-1B/1C/6
MSGRYAPVRQSKYRHVHGEAARKDKCYNNVRCIADGDSNHIKANKKFFAYAGVGGGGPIVVYPLKGQDFRLPNPTPAVNVHKAKVLDWDFSPFLDCLLATAGEDNYIKFTVFPEEGLKEDVTECAATLEGHIKKVSVVHFHPVANNILGSISFDQTLKVWDVAKQTQISSFDLPEVPQSFEWNYNGSLAGVTCKDKIVRIFDPRKPQSALSAPGLPGVKPSRCVFMDNHTKFAVLGMSATSTRQYAVYDPRKFDAALKIEDIDQSAGVLIPFYDPDNSILYLGGKGDASIKYYEAVDDDPYLHFLSEFRSNESQKGICFLPKVACETKDVEIAVALRLMKDMVQPISFQVPRKSDQFQADIYPDTYAGVPALTEDEYAAGKDKDPPLTSMKDKGSKPSASAPAAKFVAAKSAAELQKELSEAHERIRELEAQVAKLQGK